MWPVVTDGAAWSVCRSDMIVSPDPIEIFVWVVDLGGPKEPCIRWVSRSPCKVAVFREKGWPIAEYRYPLRWAVQNGWTDQDAVCIVYSGGARDVFHAGAHWRHLANTIELYMCGSDVAFLSNYFGHLLSVWLMLCFCWCNVGENCRLWRHATIREWWRIETASLCLVWTAS